MVEYPPTGMLPDRRHGPGVQLAERRTSCQAFPENDMYSHPTSCASGLGVGVGGGASVGRGVGVGCGVGATPGSAGLMLMFLIHTASVFDLPEPSFVYTQSKLIGRLAGI